MEHTCVHPAYDTIKQAESFYQVAQHEWGHIKDYQRGQHLSSPKTPSGRRIKWAKRPMEKSAVAAVMFAKKIPQKDDCIKGLALWLEKQNAPNSPRTFCNHGPVAEVRLV